jgi:hypothetical protein
MTPNKKISVICSFLCQDFLNCEIKFGSSEVFFKRNLLFWIHCGHVLEDECAMKLLVPGFEGGSKRN